MKPKLAYTLLGCCMAALGSELPRDPTRVETLLKEVHGKVARFVNSQGETAAPVCILTSQGRLWLTGDIRTSERSEPVLISQHSQSWQTCEDMAQQELTAALQK